MAKIAYMNIVGKTYPMSFSLMASKKISEKYGGLENAMEIAENNDAMAIDVVADILELLISQGCAYKNYFEKDVPTKDGDPVIKGKWEPLPREALEIAIGINDLGEVMEKIQECAGISTQREIEAEPIKKGKNAEAKQG